MRVATQRDKWIFRNIEKKSNKNINHHLDGKYDGIKGLLLLIGPEITQNENIYSMENMYLETDNIGAFFQTCKVIFDVFFKFFFSVDWGRRWKCWMCAYWGCGLLWLNIWGFAIFVKFCDSGPWKFVFFDHPPSSVNPFVCQKS